MNGAAIDPALQLIARGALALLFVSTAAHKLRDGAAFRTALSGYDLVPAPWLGAAATLLLGAEIGVAAGLWLPASARGAALAGAALLALYAAAITVNLRRGRRDIDCGCAGPARRQPISGALVVRNLVLAAAALSCALPVSPRALTWLDGATVVAGVAALALLYSAIDGLLANAPRSAALVSGAHEAAHA